MKRGVHDDPSVDDTNVQLSNKPDHEFIHQKKGFFGHDGIGPGASRML